MSIKKHYRVVIDYEVEVEDWSEAALKSERRYYVDAGTPEFAEWEESQRRLFEALLKDPRRVEQCCQRAVLDTADLDLESVIYDQRLDVPVQDDLIIQAFENLSPADAAHWREASHYNDFFEESAIVRSRIRPRMLTCTLQNVETGEAINAREPAPDQQDIFIDDPELPGSWARISDVLQGQPTMRSGPKIGRNDYCPCKSGKKFKKCCGSPVSATQP